MYQTDWALAALTLRVANPEAAGLAAEPGQPFNLPVASLEGKPGMAGRLWATFLPVAAPQEGKPPKGISLVARDMQSVVVYDSRGQFVGVRRPGSNKPIEVEGLQVGPSALWGCVPGAVARHAAWCSGRHAAWCSSKTCARCSSKTCCVVSVCCAQSAPVLLIACLGLTSTTALLQAADLVTPGLSTALRVLQVTIDNVMGSTGLEIKADPGVPWVYAGFAGLMVTTVVSYISHSQVWALQQEGSVYVAGKSNRAKVAFAKELGEVLDQVPEAAPAAAAMAGSNGGSSS
jgi:hypothetical protein